MTTSYESSSTGLVDTARASILDPEPLLPPADAVEEAQEVHTVAWLGDGSAVASWSCCHPEHERSGLFLLRSSGKEALSDDRTRAASLAVDPSGRHFAYIHHHDDGRRGTDVVVRRDLGPPQVVATGYPLIDW